MQTILWMVGMTTVLMIVMVWNMTKEQTPKNEKKDFVVFESVLSMITFFLATFSVWLFIGKSIAEKVTPVLLKSEVENGWVYIIISLTISIFFFLLSLVKVEYKHLAVLVVFGKRLPIFFSEGIWALIFPKFIIKFEDMDVKEITIGIKSEKDGKIEYKTIKTQTRDNTEVESEYADQVVVENPIKWFNTKKPAEAIENKLISQLRIIIGLFNEGDINQIKGVISGMLFGKTYVIQRLADSFLLRDRSGNVIVICVDDDLIEEEKGNKFKIAQKIKEMARGVAPFKDSDGHDFNPAMIDENSIEIIPPSTFENEGLKKEAKRVGAKIMPPSIKDITPSEEIKKAGEKIEKERLERQAREEETQTHFRLACVEIGKNPDNGTDNWTDADWQRFERTKAEIRVREEVSSEIIVRHIGSVGGNSEIGDSLIASQAMRSR